MKVIVSEEIAAVCPEFVGAAVTATVCNTPFCKELWDEIEAFAEILGERYTTDKIKTIPAVEATRRVYKVCGKDPSRYRPAAEALMRRLVQGKQLYRIDTLVDLINLVSLSSGYSIGGFDADKIAGDTLTLGIGREGEPYEGIGRGLLNIAGLPVYRDEYGGVGTPTSDNERTKIDINTRHVLILINGYDGNEDDVRKSAEYTVALLEKYACGKECRYSVYR